MVAPYENAADANQQLGQSVIMFDGNPVWVHEVRSLSSGSIVAVCYPMLAMKDMMTIPINDPRLDARDLGNRLGYVNTFQHTGAVFCSRIPARQFKQGLSKNNVAIGSRDGPRIFGFETLRGLSGFTDCLRGHYPSIQEAKDRLTKEPEIPSIAFHKYFALQHDELGFFVVMYRGERVAWGDPESFKIPTHYKYLKELMQELITFRC